MRPDQVVKRPSDRFGRNTERQCLLYDLSRIPAIGKNLTPQELLTVACKRWNAAAVRALPQKSVFRLEEVSTTCGSGWVRSHVATAQSAR